MLPACRFADQRSLHCYLFWSNLGKPFGGCSTCLSPSRSQRNSRYKSAMQSRCSEHQSMRSAGTDSRGFGNGRRERSHLFLTASHVWQFCPTLPSASSTRAISLGSCCHLTLWAEVHAISASPDDTSLASLTAGFPAVGPAQRSQLWPAVTPKRDPVWSIRDLEGLTHPTESSETILRKGRADLSKSASVWACVRDELVKFCVGSLLQRS